MLALSRAFSQMIKFIMAGMVHQQNNPNGRDSQNEAQSGHQSRVLVDSMQKLVVAAKLDTYRIMTCEYIAPWI